MDRAVRIVFVAACVCALACSGSPASNSAPTPSASLVTACSGSDPQVLFFASGPSPFSSGACEAFMEEENAGQVQATSATAPSWVYPTDGSVIDSSLWPTFGWTTAGDAGAESADGDFVIEFRQNGAEVLRAMVLGTQWPMDTLSWAYMTASPAPITATVIRVALDDGGLDTSTPASVSKPVSFTISK